MKELKTELVELINSDYADFINLSTNLNGVDRMMEDLRKPLDRMKDDAIVCILFQGRSICCLSGSILILCMA